MRVSAMKYLVLQSVFLAAVFGCKSDEEPIPPGPVAPDPYDVAVGPYSADIRWTSYGIPHIIADDFGSVGFGSGYALARDHICTLADQIVMVRSERSKYFGEAHLDNDFALKALRMVRYAEEGFLGLDEDLRSAIIGYAAGYNRYLEDVGVEGLPAECRGAPWVNPITHIDLLAYYLFLGQSSSGDVLSDLIATAQPPTMAKLAEPPPMKVLEPLKELLRQQWMGARFGTDRVGKRDASEQHPFSAVGPKQWYEHQLTVRGKLNAYGVSLIGVPIVNMGFNQHVAWTHTVSFTPRFTGYLLELEPGNPTRYLDNGEYRDMVAESFEVEVLEDDGGVRTEQRVMYRSHLGPILNAPVVGWTAYNALTYRDANENNLAMATTWLEMNQATNLAEFQAAHETNQGIPWVHTIYADDQGNAYYVDSGVTPNLTEGWVEAWEDLKDSNYLVQAFGEGGLYVFDMENPLFQWVDDERAPMSGIIPFEEAPGVVRQDYVFNANDNYWLSNAENPLPPASPIYGAIETPRSPRTRMNAHYLRPGTDSPAGTDGRFSLVELQQTVFDADMISSLHLKDLVVERCLASPVITVDDREVDLTEACEVLAAWDGKGRVDSIGAHIWREFVANEGYSWSDLIEAGQLYGVPFDPTSPVYTPTGLSPLTADGVDSVL